MSAPLLRFAREHMLGWRADPERKPLFVEGARQTGKTHLVAGIGREFCGALVHIDFEQNPDVDRLFACQAPREICELLEFRLGERIEPGRTLLFLDEIQNAPHAATVLGRFRSAFPGLHVAAAGTLQALAPGAAPLAAALAAGDLEPFHLGPLTFDEFLLATGESRSFGLLATLPAGETFGAQAHEPLMHHARRYLCAGGMPAAVAALAADGSLRACVEARGATAVALREDFLRWGGRFDPARVAAALARWPALVGARFMYSALGPGARARDLRPLLDALVRARIFSRVPCARCTGLPLDATVHPRQFRLLFLDVGLQAAAAGVSPADIEAAADPLAVAGGALCSQFVGQHLLYSRGPRVGPELHCWEREARTSQAEIDYVLAEGAHIVPVTIRPGKTGTLRALHRFVHERGPVLAVRLYNDPPALEPVSARLSGGQTVNYTLLSLPFYMAGHVRRLCREWLAANR